MSAPLRVLFVEDSEDDMLLILRELKRGGYDVMFERVDTLEDMRSALSKGKWDIILSDYTMPHFSAQAALSLFKEMELDIPFIIVSGAIGEQTAVALMKAGAHDFVMKGNLARLVPAIQRELSDAKARRERKQAQEKLKNPKKDTGCYFKIHQK